MTNKPRPSPSPWTLHTFETGGEIVDAKGKLLAEVPVYVRNVPVIRQHANLKLMAAAPELLAQLELSHKLYLELLLGDLPQGAEKTAEMEQYLETTRRLISRLTRKE